MFTLGGGYAMIPIIEAEVVDKNKWIEKEEFLDLIAIAQSCPGVFAVNVSIFIGYKMRKLRGALCTCIGTALPSFLIILLIAMFFHQFQDNSVVAAAFRGIRPAVVALIAAPTFNLAKSAHITLFAPCLYGLWASTPSTSSSVQPFAVSSMVSLSSPQRVRTTRIRTVAV